MTFLDKTKRFFEPIKGRNYLIFVSIIKFSTWAIYALFSVYIIRESVKMYGTGDINGLIFLCKEYVIFTIFYFGISYLVRRSDWPQLWHDIQRWIYKKYLREIIEMDGNALEKIGTGKIIAIITGAEKMWIDSILNVMKEGTKIGIVSLYIGYLLFQQEFIFGVIFIVVFILLHGAIVYLDSIAHKNRKIRTEHRTELTRDLVRITMSRNEILQAGSIQKDIQKAQEIMGKMQEANNNINNALFKIFNLVKATASSIRIGFIVFLILSYKEFSIPIEDVAGILGLLIVFESFLFDSTEFYKNFTKDFSDIEKLWTTFDNAPKLKGYHTGSPFTKEKKDIVVENVSYGYNDTKVFENLSLTIPYGKKTALVGASGGGKTTLMKLIAGYLHPESGHISVMGNVLSETALKSYYPHIGYLTQEPSVFDATIRENLVSAISGASMTSVMSRESSVSVTTSRHPAQDTGVEQDFSSSQKQMIRNDNSIDSDDILVKALKLAHCDFVFELEKGLDTEIGERGVRLSGGQKQRLAIAKIFLKDPEIILLDEPTSALDSFSEEHITKALDELFKNRTVIVIAHRLQTVKKADDIIVLEGGKVVERGDHEELVKKGGIYNRMLELQSGF